jgi:hypothetical protein
MPPDFRSAVARAGAATLANRHGRPFVTSVRAFVTALRCPDARPTDFSHGQLAATRDLAEMVIAEIEDRLEDDDDHPRIQRELARTICTIRRLLEERHPPERHFARPENSGASAAVR